MITGAHRRDRIEARDARFESELKRIRSAYERRRDIAPETYSSQNPAVRLAVEERRGHTLALLCAARLSLPTAAILDVGCGTGAWTREFIHWGTPPAHIAAIDLLPERLEIARRLTPAGVTWRCGSAHQLPFANDSFDLVLQSTMFSSILDRALRQQIAAEMLRVTRPGRFVLWYDFFLDNPSNPDVAGVRKPEIRRLFPGCRITCRRLTLAPPIARIVGPMSAPMYRLLSATKFLCTHYLALIAKPL